MLAVQIEASFVSRGSERSVDPRNKIVSITHPEGGVTGLPEAHPAIWQAGCRNSRKASQAFDALMDRRVSIA